MLGNPITELGPIPYTGPGLIKEVITNNLRENHSYTLTVKVERGLQVTTSYKHVFSEFSLCYRDKLTETVTLHAYAIINFINKQ